MPARKSKKSATRPVKKVSKSKNISSSFGPVHFIMVGVTAAVLLAGFLFYQQNIQSPTSPKNELKKTLSVDRSSFDQDKMGDESTNDQEGMLLKAIGNSKQSGSIMINESDGMAVVSVRLLGSSESNQPVNIHYGSCAYPGEVKYQLVDLTDGSSKTTLEVSEQQLMWGLPLSIMVHASVSDDTVVACADLSN